VTATLPASDIAYANGQFVAVGSGHVYLSPDGATWSDQAVTGINGAIACHLQTCVVVGGSHAWRSADSGRTWGPAAASAASTQAIVHVTWGE